jgi:hypothetical protein
VDCGKIPDAALTLAVAGGALCRGSHDDSQCLFETERMKAIVAEGTELSPTVEELEDYCIIHPPAKLDNNVLIETYDQPEIEILSSQYRLGGIAYITAATPIFQISISTPTPTGCSLIIDILGKAYGGSFLCVSYKLLMLGLQSGANRFG